MITLSPREKRIKKIEEELERWKYNEKIRDTILMIIALIIIIGLGVMMLWF